MIDMPQSLPASSFKILFSKEGYSKKIIEELWKWYDYREKKGVASY
jgi:hypothetical protein